MWLLGVVLCFNVIVINGQSLDEEGLRCYDCNSFNPHCRNEVNQSSPTEGFAVFTRCPITQRCFIRKDKDGVIVRGCADGWRFSLIDIEYMGCKEQSVDWLGPQVWCFCDEDLCNQVPMQQLNRGQYMQLAQSSEYFSVDADLNVEHELTGWLGPELLQKQLQAEEDNDTVPQTTTESSKATQTTTNTSKATRPKTTISSSTFHAKLTTKSNKKSTIKSTSLHTSETFSNTNTASSDTTLAQSTKSNTKLTTKTNKRVTSSSTATKTDHTHAPDSTSKLTTKSIPSNSTFVPSINSTEQKPRSKSTIETTKNTTSLYQRSSTLNESSPSATVGTTSVNASSSTIKPQSDLVEDKKKVELPWWLWHVVSSTETPTKSTKTPKPSTMSLKATRRSYLKPKVRLVTTIPTDDVKKAEFNSRKTTPASMSERWTWSPSWWDKWWRPGTRRPRKPKRPSSKYPRRPPPTQGKGHYWWLAPVGPTVAGPKHPKHRLPATKAVTLSTMKSRSTQRKQRTTTQKAIKTTNKPKAIYPQHIVATSTPAPVREYPKYPQWGRRINSNKSIYPVRTTRRRRPTTKPATRRRPVSISTRKIKLTPTKPTPTTVKVSTRRRRPTTISRRRIYPMRKPKPKTQQKDSDPFFCWDCYSASTNCRDVVNSPYSYYVGRTPCPFTRKCFVRKDNGVTYRGCADGWTSSLIDSNYTGCKVQFTWGRPVEWCFCDSNLCNGKSLKHIKQRYSDIKGTDNVILSLPNGGVDDRSSRDKLADENSPR